MVLAVQLKRLIAGACIFSIIISKLTNWQKLCLVILFKVDKSSKVSFYYTVLTFGLAIYLGIKDYEKSLFNSKEVSEP